jgi:hypothetical protein
MFTKNVFESIMAGLIEAKALKNLQKEKDKRKDIYYIYEDIETRRLCAINLFMIQTYAWTKPKYDIHKLYKPHMFKKMTLNYHSY